MSLLNFFKKKSKESILTSPQLPVAESDTEPAPIAESANTTAGGSGSDVLKVSILTGWPIDRVYGHLHTNYEEKGYADALANSNLKFRDMNMALIRNRILMVFREVNLRYDALRTDLENRIEICGAAGLLTNVADLNKSVSVIDAHKNELAQLEADFRNNANVASIPLMSYECGFLRGVSAIAMSAPSAPASMPAVPQTPAIPFLSSNRESA